MIDTTVVLAAERSPSPLTARNRPVDARSGTTTSTLLTRCLSAVATALSLWPPPPRKTIVRTPRIPVPRTRSRLPGCAAVAPAQPLMQLTAEIVAGSDAIAPPELAPAGPATPMAQPSPHSTATTPRFSLISPLVCGLRG